MRRFQLFLLSAAVAALLQGCKKDDSLHVLTIIPHYHVDGQELVMDTIRYQNAAGNPYSVNKLRYYLSNFRFVENDNSVITIDENAFYFDAREGTTLTLREIPDGSFKEIRFNFGVPPQLNTYGNLPNTLENTHMAWPEQMGGGYHFLQLEGYFNSTSGTDGFAIHIGDDSCLTDVSVATPFDVNGDVEMTLGFNINEIMSGPNIFNLDSSNYTMGNMAAMQAISSNMHNVFTLEQAP